MTNSNNGNSKILLTVAEFCARASIGRTTLYELTRSKKIRTVKIGPRGIRIPVAELQRFIDEQLGSDLYPGGQGA